MILPFFSREQGLETFLNEYSRVLTADDAKNFKKGQDLKLTNGERLVLVSPDGSQFYLSVSDAGVLSVKPMIPSGASIEIITSPVTMTYGRAATRPRLVIG